MRIRIKKWLDQSEWHKVFLWKPRRIGEYWVRLETVERRRWFDRTGQINYEYRLYDPPKYDTSMWVG